MKPLSYYDLLDQFSESGCAVCGLLRRDAQRFLDALLYEQVNDPGIRDGFRQRRGLCNAHSWQLVTFGGNALGVSLLYRSSLDEVLRLTRQHEPSLNLEWLLPHPEPPAAKPLAGNLGPTRACLVCAHLGASEKDYLWVLAEHFSDPDLLAAYRTSQGLCLPHFRMFLRQPQPFTTHQQAIEIQTAIWSHLSDQLGELIAATGRKPVDPAGQGAHVLRQVIQSLVGVRGIFDDQA